MLHKLRLRSNKQLRYLLLWKIKNVDRIALIGVVLTKHCIEKVLS